MNELVLKYKEAAECILRVSGINPEVGIVLGSGLARLADFIEQPVVIPYSEIPHFKTSTAMGHKSNLIVGYLGGKSVAAMQGRFHYYEGYTMHEVTFPIRVMRYLGVKTLFVSNAAGGVNATFRVGDMMIIHDHINFLPNPLVGPNVEELGPRFPDMTRAYDRELIALIEQIASEKGVELRKGVYVGLTGPSFETPAEYAFFGARGGDVVGMSTVPEVIVARHCGMRVFGMSVVSNEAHSFADDFENDGADVVAAVNKVADTMSALFVEAIRRL